MRVVWFGVLTVTLHLAVASSGAAQSAPMEPLRLEELVAEARAKNPELKAAGERWQAARKRIPQASALPDPTVGYAFMGEMLETRVGPQEDVYEVEQMVPFPGKLLARRHMALAEARAAEAQHKATERDIVRRVTEAYANLYVTDESLRSLEETQHLLESLESIAQARYASQGGSQRDVAKAQAEASSLLQQVFMLRQQRQAQAALLAALLDRDARTAVDQVAPPVRPTLALTLDELLEVAARRRPQLQEASQMVARDRQASRLAKFEYFPDLSVGFQYSQIGSGMTTDPDDGRDAWMVPLRMTIPLWQNRLVPGVLEAKRNLNASRAQFEQAKNLGEYEVKDAYYRFLAAQQVVALTENALIPEAKLALNSDEAAYEAGQTDALNLIDSERVYLNAKVSYHQALAELLKSYAALEQAVGTELAALSQPKGTQ
jgi:outer membrane protein TolC